MVVFVGLVARSGRWRREALGALVAVLALACCASTAFAAFPGKNGRIVFVKLAGNGSPLYSVKPDGSRLRKITGHGYDSSPSVAPNGRVIAFARDGAIFTVHKSGEHLTRLTQPGRGYEPTFSGPLGRRIAFTRPFDPRFVQIWLMASDGTKERRLLSNPRTADRAPAFSPNGKWIAFARRPGKDGEIFKVHSDGSDLRRLTHSKRSNSVPSFGPKGKSIVYNRFSSNGTPAIHIMRANGTHDRRLRRGWTPAFSPNGKRIVFEWQDAIYTMKRRGGHLRQVTPDSWTASDPDWAVRPN